MIRSIFLINLTLALGLGSASLVQAGATDEAMLQLEAIMADEDKRNASYAAGHERIRFCGYCHGEDGNSKRDYIPNLATQHPQYLFEQFEKFGDGRREDYVMSTLAKSLSQQERIDIAVYYSQQTANPRPGGDPALAAAGEPVYERSCSFCHGENAQGFRNMPRLAGQPAPYIETSLKRFKEMDPQQDSSPMIGVAKALSDSDISAVATYLQSR